MRSKNTIFNTVREALKKSDRLLQKAQIDSHRLDAELLLAHALSVSRLEIITSSQRPLSIEEQDRFLKLLERRLHHEPIAYILGKKEFYGHDFFVEPGVLIPRPDTESVIEQCLKLIPHDASFTVLDICAGTGCIGITLALERRNLNVFCGDISSKALLILKKNVAQYGLENRVKIRQGDLLNPFLDCNDVHLIVANPPYIALKELETLPLTVRGFEPFEALIGEGAEGIGLHVRLMEEAPAVLKKPGYLIMEFASHQKSLLANLKSTKWEEPEFFNDLSGQARGVILKIRD